MNRLWRGLKMAAMRAWAMPWVMGLGTAAGSPLDALTGYDGDWLVTLASTTKTDELRDRCHMVEAYYTCEQLMEGTSQALPVFTAAGGVGKVHRTVVMPHGTPRGRRQSWRLRGRAGFCPGTDDQGKPSFGVENVVRDRNHIHFEQDKANDKWRVGEGRRRG